VWSVSRLADRDVGARADALRVRDEGGAAVILVFDSARYAARQQAQLAVERRLPVSGGHRLQVNEGRLEPPRHLREAAGGEPDLVERETDVAVPVEYALDQPQLVVLVADVALAGALDLIRRLGGGTVDGYPEAAGSVPAGFLFNGALSTYEQLGFVRDRKIGKHRWVVTKVVEPTR
jgi:hypothetical protein